MSLYFYIIRSAKLVEKLTYEKSSPISLISSMATGGMGGFILNNLTTAEAIRLAALILALQISNMSSSSCLILLISTCSNFYIDLGPHAMNRGIESNCIGLCFGQNYQHKSWRGRHMQVFLSTVDQTIKPSKHYNEVLQTWKLFLKAFSWWDPTLAWSSIWISLCRICIIPLTPTWKHSINQFPTQKSISTSCPYSTKHTSRSHLKYVSNVW